MAIAAIAKLKRGRKRFVADARVRNVVVKLVVRFPLRLQPLQKLGPIGIERNFNNELFQTLCRLACRFLLGNLQFPLAFGMAGLSGGRGNYRLRSYRSQPPLQYCWTLAAREKSCRESACRDWY